MDCVTQPVPRGTPDPPHFHFRCDDGRHAFGVVVSASGLIVWEGRAPRWQQWIGRTWAELKAAGVSWYPTGVCHGPHRAMAPPPTPRRTPNPSP